MSEHSAYLGIVLAAGRSERMGRSKALLPTGEDSFLRAAVDTLTAGGCDPVVVVTGSEEVEAEARSAGAEVVWNDATDAEQIDSLRLGLEAGGGATSGAVAAVVLPVDHPLVRVATVGALIEAAERHPGAIVRPVLDGRPGHPTLFPRAVWPRLLDPDLPNGARSLVEDAAVETVDVPVDDQGVVADIDTPDLYERYLGPLDP
jgi:molybdenum cofactor cytidylyltransferase